MDMLPDEVMMIIMRFSQMPRLARVCKRFYHLEYNKEMVETRVQVMDRRYKTWMVAISDVTQADDHLLNIVKGNSMDDLRYFYHRNKLRVRSDRMIVCNMIAHHASILGRTKMFAWMLIKGIDNYETVLTNAIAHEHGDIVLALIRWQTCLDKLYPRLKNIVIEAMHQYSSIREIKRFSKKRKHNPFLLKTR